MLVACSKPDPAPAPARSTIVTSSSSVVRHSSAPPAPTVGGAASARETEEPPEQRDDGNASARWIADEPVNIAPAGPATASSRGVVMIDRKGQLLVAKLQRTPTGGEPAPTRVERLDAQRERFFSYGVGPAVIGDDAFFVHGGKLHRRSIGESGPDQVLATDARNGTRVAAVSIAVGGKSVPVVAYIAQAGDHPVARLWIEGQPLRTLSPEGSAASSVALTTHGRDLIAVAIEGRSGMSPVHARRIRIDQGAPRLDEDQVVWVAGSSQSLTEVRAVGSDVDAWAFVAIEKDTTHFGLARIHVGTKPRTDSEISWRDYPNGLDPAPVDTTTLCSEPTVLYARPSEATPRAPQELHLAAITPKGLSPSQKVAFAGAFTNASIAPTEGGALVAYVGDGRTWALSVRCGPKPRPQPIRSLR
jgi:hypothetical protein